MLLTFTNPTIQFFNEVVDIMSHARIIPFNNPQLTANIYKLIEYDISIIELNIQRTGFKMFVLFIISVLFGYNLSIYWVYIML
ncbi:hypothetical protein GCM10007383_24730 [Arenibacter certesii]|uniref:Uncharacterized protein n=1 Tax=Arenibacter certesii TaxID=228955 RepID=A0A918MML3_9FLAO|nr:hypothetical protein GCM10007383_24730 [Arenibacter certesii]